jgi:hypothetical protein
MTELARIACAICLESHTSLDGEDYAPVILLCGALQLTPRRCERISIESNDQVMEAVRAVS